MSIQRSEIYFVNFEFCARLSKKTGKVYRLPSEAEWEYACRATTETPYQFGDAITEKMANFSGREPFKKTTPVGSYTSSNVFGLYDMHGNVWEWCADPWHENYKDAWKDGRVQEDPSAKEPRLRGGLWLSEAN